MFTNDENPFGFFFLRHFTRLAAALPEAYLFSLSLGFNKELHFMGCRSSDSGNFNPSTSTSPLCLQMYLNCILSICVPYIVLLQQQILGQASARDYGQSKRAMNKSQNLPSFKQWSLEAFTSLCRWKETLFRYSETEAVREMHTNPKISGTAQASASHAPVCIRRAVCANFSNFRVEGYFSPQHDVHLQL